VESTSTVPSSDTLKTTADAMKTHTQRNAAAAMLRQRALSDKSIVCQHGHNVKS
jgi:hypothetical protein